MTSHARTPRKTPKSAVFNHRRITRQNSVPSRSTSVAPSAAVKPDLPNLNGGPPSMSADFTGHHGHSQLSQQQNFSDGHVLGGHGMHTPQGTQSFSSFETPVDLSGATLLSQSEYHTLSNSLPASALNSYRQSNGETSHNAGFTLSTPQHNPFHSGIGPHTPSHPTPTPETHSHPPPVPRGPFPGYLPRQPAADVVRTVRSEGFRLNGTVCKKLALEPAVREPEQRNPDRVLNMGRRGNAEALLCQITGQEATNACKNCKRGHGPWSKCIVYAGLFYGSCSNCWFNASGARCTFQESNHHPLHQIYASMAPAYNNPFGPGTHGTAYSSGGTIGPSPASSLPYGPLPSAIRSREGIPFNNLHFRRSNGASNGEDGSIVPGSTHPADTEIIDLGSVHQITEGMVTDSVTWGIRARLLVRIQAAASELGMRLGEYEEFLTTNGLTPTEPSGLFSMPFRSYGRQDGALQSHQPVGHHQQRTQSPSELASVEKHDAEMSESDDVEGSEDADTTLGGMTTSAMS